MKISRGLWTVAGVAAMLWVAAPAASHGPSGHGEAPQPGSKDAMKAQHERMANFKKATDMLDLKLEIMVVSFWPKFDLLQLDLHLFFPCFLKLFALLIFELSEVHNPADRGNRRRGNLHEVKMLAFR